MRADFIQNVVNGQRFIIYFHGPFDDAFCQPHVDIAVVDDAVSQKRVDDSLQVTYTAIGCLGNETDDILWYVEAVTFDFAV